MPIPNSVVQLIQRFDDNLQAYRSGHYNETQVRREFIDPLFEALGWDLTNRRGVPEPYKDVIHEDSIKIGEEHKAPDYSFRVAGARKFFVEAKKPATNLRDSPHPAYQLRRYAWSAKLPLSVLTDFEEFVVYDCRIPPDKTDKPSTARVRYYHFKDYPKFWDEIADLFSRDAVQQGSLDQFAETDKTLKGQATVDTAFLKEIETWREILAQSISEANPELNQRQLNYSVQMTIDRMIFLRICEDRGIEPYGRLQTLNKVADAYDQLVQFYRFADSRYNSGLFHFNDEKGRDEAPDDLTPYLNIPNEPLRAIIQGLYYPDSPYEFSVMPIEVLGQVYEQFLGKVIRLTPEHKAIVEDKPEVRKAGGVYYTPTYVVNYVVRHTLGALLKGKTPKHATKIRILDPACGSGSFLIGAYQYLLDWHRDWYIEHDPNKQKDHIYQGQGGEWFLTASARKRILLNNIYGVDIDPQAVEVTKLSLLLKVLEGETDQSLATQLSFFQERALPDLGRNIQSGNSLISNEIFNTRQMTFFDDEELYRINAFDWENGFPVAMVNGGFDVVIGNPPWGADFAELELSYLRDRYKRVINRMVDSYIYFSDLALRLVKEKGKIGFVVPSTILNQVDAANIRKLLLERGLDVIVNLGQGIFGPKVLNTSTIFISSGATNNDSVVVEDFSALPLPGRKLALERASGEITWRQWHSLVRNDPHLTFFTGNMAATALFDHLRQACQPLETILAGKIQRGVSPDVVAAHIVTEKEVTQYSLERELLRPSVSGSQIKRYHPWECDEFIIYTTRTTAIEKYPNILRYLEMFHYRNTCKEVLQGKHPWWALHRPRDPQIFQAPKLIGLTTAKTIELIYDADSSVYVTDAMYIFSLLPEYDPRLVMAVLQSRMFLFLYRISNQGESRVIPQVKASKLQSLPFPNIAPSNPYISDVIEFVDRLFALHTRLASTKGNFLQTPLKRQIQSGIRALDQLVYELYGLSQHEIDIVEATVTQE